MDAPLCLEAFVGLDAQALAAWAQTRAAELDLDLAPWREGVVEALAGLQSHAQTLARALAPDGWPPA